jgi:hypothetical protein
MAAMSAVLSPADRLPELLDVAALRSELGVSRAAAEAIMCRLPIVAIEDLRKTYVRRDDVRRYLDRTEVANGFGNRFLWICVRRSKSLPEGGQMHTVNFVPLVTRYGTRSGSPHHQARRA